MLPPHATWGQISDSRAEVLPHYWAVLRQTQQYRGHYGPFGASALETVEYSGFRLFANLRSALTAI